MLTFNDYQNAALTTAIYPNVGNNLVYPILGLSGEAGEVSEKMKKIIRDKNGIATEEDKQAIAKELGDVLWYAAVTAYEAGITLEEVAQRNLAKLAKRKETGTLQGSGDDRELATKTK